MKQNTDHTIDVQFNPSGERTEVSSDKLKKRIIKFLDRYGEASYLGEPFYRLLAGGGAHENGDAAEDSDLREERVGRGESRFENLLAATGLGEADFFEELCSRLAESNHRNFAPISIGGVPLPKRFLLTVLEELIPGEELVTVRGVEQFEKLANVSIPKEEREPLQEVIETYPVRLSKHVIRQGRVSKDIAYQFMPFVEELDDSGLKNTWVGQFHRGLIEQMYQNRPIFVLHMSCPVYCRFCFRKHKDTRNQAAPTVEDVDEAIEYIRSSPRIKEIVLTGGEPLLNKRTLTRAVEGLSSIAHIQTIRIASRCISYYPQLFYQDDSFWLNYLIDTNGELQRHDTRIEIATHFIHPDEISLQSLEIISKLVNHGVQVYTQSPFLNNCNDSGTELTELYRELRGAGSELHYIYIPASPIQGNSVYWTPIAKGHEAAAYLRAHLSDRAMPILCTATRIGKIDWNASGWAVEQSRENPENIWIRTPYNADYYRDFVPKFEFDGARENRHGTIDAEFMAEIGDKTLFLGPFDANDTLRYEPNKEKLETVQHELQERPRLDEGVVQTGVESVYRSHMTRVDVDIKEAMGSQEEFARAIAYIEGEKLLTDVVLCSAESLLDAHDEIVRFAEAIYEISHVNALRLRSSSFTYEPKRFTDEVIHRMIALNRISATNPTRVEIEAQFIHSSEFTREHRRIIKRFLSGGVTVYNNIILISEINDTEEEMKLICYNSRQIGIELFQLYAAGLPIQNRHNSETPIEATRVINIATQLRRHQSGREIPLYVVRTPLGEVDFNLNGIIVASEESRVRIKLLPYSLEHFRRIDPDFRFSEAVEVKDGVPELWISGLTVRSNEGFFIRP